MRMPAPTRLLAAAALAALLSGCIGPFTPGPSGEESPGAISVTREQGGRFLAFVGPRSQHDPLFLGVPDTNYDVLRSWLDTRSGETAHQIYVEDSYTGSPRNWDAAQDQSGTRLRFIAISTNKITCDRGCSYAEEFAAALPEPVLRASTQGGLTVFFRAKSGAQMTIHISGEEIANQLAAVASARAGIASHPASAPAKPTSLVTAPPAATAPTPSAAPTPARPAAATPMQPAAATPMQPAAATPMQPAAATPMQPAAAAPMQPAAAAPPPTFEPGPPAEPEAVPPAEYESSPYGGSETEPATEAEPPPAEETEPGAASGTAMPTPPQSSGR